MHWLCLEKGIGSTQGISTKVVPYNPRKPLIMNIGSQLTRFKLKQPTNQPINLSLKIARINSINRAAKDYQEMGHSSEMWFHPKGAGARAHMAPCKELFGCRWIGMLKEVAQKVHPYAGFRIDGNIVSSKDLSHQFAIGATLKAVCFWNWTCLVPAVSRISDFKAYAINLL